MSKELFGGAGSSDEQVAINNIIKRLERLESFKLETIKDINELDEWRESQEEKQWASYPHDKLIEERDDMVNHPPHYTQGNMETINIMEAKSTPEEFKGHLKLTALKYITRAGHKDDELQDAKKTQWYVNRWVKTIEKQIVNSK